MTIPYKQELGKNRNLRAKTSFNIFTTYCRFIFFCHHKHKIKYKTIKHNVNEKDLALISVKH